MKLILYAVLILCTMPSLAQLTPTSFPEFRALDAYSKSLIGTVDSIMTGTSA